MDPTKSVTCPDCGTDFKPADRTWSVCLECGTIISPDEDWGAHKEDECIRMLGMSQRCYSAEEAEARQERWIARRRPGMEVSQ